MCHIYGSSTNAFIHFQIAIQSVVSARESRLSKKGRRGADFTPVRFFIHFYLSSADVMNAFFIINSECICVANKIFNCYLIYDFDSKGGAVAVDLVKLFGIKSSVVR